MVKEITFPQKLLFMCVFLVTQLLRLHCSWKAWIPYISLTTTVDRLSLLQLTILSRSAIVVQARFWWCFVLSICFWELFVNVLAFVTCILSLSQFIFFRYTGKLQIKHGCIVTISKHVGRSVVICGSIPK